MFKRFREWHAINHFVAFKGATGYEAQLWRLGVYLPYWRFIRVGVWPYMYVDRSN